MSVHISVKIFLLNKMTRILWKVGMRVHVRKYFIVPLQYSTVQHSTIQDNIQYSV